MLSKVNGSEFLCLLDLVKEGRICDILSLFADSELVEIIYKSEGADFYKKFYFYLGDEVERLCFGDLAEQPLEKFALIDNKNLKLMSYNGELRLNKVNTDCIFSYLIKIFYEYKEEVDAEIVKDEFRKKYQTSLLKDFSFLSEVEDSDGPVNVYSMMVALRVLADVAPTKGNNFTLGLVDYFHTIRKKSFVYVDLFLCYLAIFHFVAVCQQKTVEMKVFATNSMVEDFSFNLLEKEEFLLQLQDNDIGKLFVDFLISSLDSTRRIEMTVLEINQNIVGIVNSCLSSLAKPDRYLPSAYSLYELRLNISYYFILDTDLPEFLAQTQVTHLHLNIIDHTEITCEVNLKTLFKNNCTKGICVQGKRLEVRDNIDHPLPLKNFALITREIFLGKINFLANFIELQNLTLKEISFGTLERLTNFISETNSLKFLRYLDLHVRQCKADRNLEIFTTMNKFISSVLRLEYLRTVKLTVKCSELVITDRVAKCHVASLRASKTLSFFSMIVSQDNSDAKSRSRLETDFKQNNPIAFKVIESLDFSKNLHELSKENKLIYIENSEGSQPDAPKLVDWNSFDSLLLAICNKDKRKLPLDRLRRPVFLAHLLNFLGSYSSRIFYIEQINLNII